MRILHTESSCGWGGQELRILEESRGMVARGHAVTIAAPGGSRILAEAHLRGLAAVELPIARKNLSGVSGLARFLRSNAFDIINTHSSTDSWLAAIACRLVENAPRLVRTRHISAPIPNNWATRWLYLSATAHVVTTGEALLKQLVGQNGYPPSHLSSVPTGIDTGRYCPGDKGAARRGLALPRDRILIGIVATLRSWKGHRYLIEAFAGIGRQDCTLVIVGDGPQRASLESQAAVARLGERVIFCGNQADVLPWLRALDVFALPSYANEGVPQALVQAMLCRLACVTTGVGSIGEAAVAEKTALVVAPRDTLALRAALQRLVLSERLRDRLGRAARDWCATRFDFERMLDAMESVFGAVIAQSASSATQGGA